MDEARRLRDLLVVLTAIALLVSAFPAAAQQECRQQPPPSNAMPQGLSGTQFAGEQGPSSQTPTPGMPSKDDRLFWTLPNLLTVENAGFVPPLTPAQKFQLITRQSFDPIEYPFAGFLALVSQAENSEPSFGQGASGYAKRYGAAFGDATVGGFMTSAVFPSLLRQDPRYFQLGKGSFFRRAGYSISRIFITRADDGRKRFNYSEIGGNAVAAGISNSYHPRQDRSVTNTMSVWWSDIGWDTVSNVAKEFWPDIRQKLRRKPATPVETPEL